MYPAFGMACWRSRLAKKIRATKIYKKTTFRSSSMPMGSDFGFIYGDENCLRNTPTRCPSHYAYGYLVTYLGVTGRVRRRRGCYRGTSRGRCYRGTKPQTATSLSWVLYKGNRLLGWGPFLRNTRLPCYYTRGV